MSSASEAAPVNEDALADFEAGAAHDANGVDRSLVRWMLRQTPAQRLAYAQSVIDLATAARRSRDGAR